MRRDTQSARGLLLLVVLGGCGPTLETVAECEGDGPTQLVTLREGPSTVTVFRGVRDERGWLVFDGEGDHGRNLAVECGQVPRVFAHDIPNVLRFDPRGPWLGYRHPPNEWPQFFVLDPWGGTPPRPLPPHLLGTVDDGLLLGGSSSSGVSLWHAKFGDAFELEPIALDLRTTAGQSVDWPPHPAVAPVDLVFVRLRESGRQTTIGFDPLTGERRFSEEKSFVQARMGGRFVILSDDTPGGAYSYMIVDTNDPSRRIEEFPSPHGCCQQQPDLVVAQRYEGQEVVETRIVTLPDLREHVLEGEWTSWNMSRALPDGRRILLSPNGFYALEPDSSNLEIVHPRPGYGWIVGDDLWVIEDAPTSHASAPHDVALVRVPLDGSPAVTVLEPPLESWAPLPHGRWALTRENRDGRTDLRIYDPSTARETIVVEEIDVGFWRWNLSGLVGPNWFDPVIPPEWDDIIFSKTDDDGRSVWRYAP